MSSPTDPGSKPNTGDKQAAKQRSSRPKPKAEAKPAAPAAAAKDLHITPGTASRPVADKATEDIVADFKAGQPAPSNLFAVMNADGIEDAFSTDPPERGHQLAFAGRVVDLAVIHEIDNVKRVAVAASA